MKPRVKTKVKVPPRTTVVLKPDARKKADALAVIAKRSFSKQVEFLIEEEYKRLFGEREAA